MIERNDILRKNSNDILRKNSGDIKYSDPLTTFFYLLMRDCLPVGEVARLVLETTDGAGKGGFEISFTNGWLAQYANNLSEQIKNAEENGFKKALQTVFENEIKNNISKEKVVFSVNNGARSINLIDAPKEEIEDSDLCELQGKISDEAADIIVNQLKTEPIKSETNIEDDIRMAKEEIELLKSNGKITEEDANRIHTELDEQIEISCDFVDEKNITETDPEIEEALKDLDEVF